VIATASDIAFRLRGPELEKIQPLVVILADVLLQKPHGPAQARFEIAITVAGLRQLDRFAHDHAIPQPAVAHHEARQHRRARDVSQKKRAQRKAGGRAKERDLGTEALIYSVALNGHDLIGT